MADPLLMALWSLSLVMAAISVGILGVVIVQRLISQNGRMKREKLREALIQELFTVTDDWRQSVEPLKPLILDGKMVGQTIIEYTTLVRGSDLDNAACALRAAGAEHKIISTLTKGAYKYRRVAAEALSIFRSEKSIAALRAVLFGNAPGTVKVAAARSLLSLGAPLPLDDVVSQFQTAELDVPLELIAVLEAYAKASPEALAERLEGGSDSVELRCLMIDALGKCDAYNAIPVLEQCALDPSSRVRATAIRALGRLELPISASVLNAALVDNSNDVRAEAVEAIGAVVMPEYAGKLEEMLDDRDWKVRFGAGAAMVALGKVGQDRLSTVAAGGASEVARRTASLTLTEKVAA